MSDSIGLVNGGGFNTGNISGDRVKVISDRILTMPSVGCLAAVNECEVNK